MMEFVKITIVFFIICIYTNIFSLDIFAEKNKNSHQVLIIIPERDFSKNNDNQKMLEIDSEINVKIFRNKTKPIYEVSKTLKFRIPNRINENANIPIFLAPNLKAGYYRFTVRIYNKREDIKSEYKEIVSVPRTSEEINNVYLFAYENGTLIAPTIPIMKKNDYDSLRVVGSFNKKIIKKIRFEYSDKKSRNFNINDNEFEMNLPNDKYKKTGLKMIFGDNLFYQDLDFFTFTKRFQFTYSVKEQLKQLSLIIKNSDFKYLKSVPKLQLQTEISKFWNLNNPNSEYGENQFQKIFYQRIIYADENFTVRGYLPGWRTDRGKIYVKYGKPDEVYNNNYPLKKKANIIWKYYKIDKIFVFYDFRGYGNYELEDKWNEE